MAQPRDYFAVGRVACSTTIVISSSSGPTRGRRRHPYQLQQRHSALATNASLQVVLKNTLTVIGNNHGRVHDRRWLSAESSGVLRRSTGSGGGAVTTLLGNNAYTGGTTVASGTLTAGKANSLGRGLLTISGGNVTTTAQLHRARYIWPACRFRSRSLDLNNCDA